MFYHLYSGGRRPRALLGLGRELYRWLDGRERWMDELTSQLTPPLVLEIQAGLQPDPSAWAVLQAPWELLANAQGYLAEGARPRFAPARRLGTARPPAKLDEYRLGIAFMAASPEGEPELDYEGEEAAILNKARDLDLYVEESGDPDELSRRLNDFEPPLPVLHLSCHGNNVPQPVLMLEDAYGHKQPTTADGLVEALGACRPRLLMLSACLSAAGGERASGAPILDSLVSTMVRAGFAAVIGWDGSVADAAATRFAGEFYDNLGRRQSIVEAAAGARRALLAGTSAAGRAGNKDGADAGSLGQQLATQQQAIQRDWHLARVWLGPEGGGPIVGLGRTKPRSMLPHDYAYKQILTIKQDEQLVVAGAAMFVDRRRELQQSLRILAGSDYAGVLLHGLGRTGKSSLAARLASRRQDLTLAVVYRNYDARSILEAIAQALKGYEPSRRLLDKHLAKIGNESARQEEVLEEALLDLLAGPCREGAKGKPLLLLIDDLERVLEAGEQGIHSVQQEVRPALRAVLQAFDPSRSESRLLITSRFRFSLAENGVELADRLWPLQLPPFNETAQRKLSVRQQQQAAARMRLESRGTLDENALAARLPLLERAQRLARGNPGLQDLLGARLVLRPAVPLARVKAVLEQTEAYLTGSDALPESDDVREFLQNLALDQLLEEAGAAGQALLRSLRLFELPVPMAVAEGLAKQVGGAPDVLLALGLLDRFPDLVDRDVTAVAANALAAGRRAPLSDAEQVTLAAVGLPILFAAWGAEERSNRWPYAVDVELTRLGLLALDFKVIAHCAANAVHGLADDFQPGAAAKLGQAAVVALEQASLTPSLTLVARTAAALSTTGEGQAAEGVLGKGAGRLGDIAAEAGLDPAELRYFYFELGNQRLLRGNPEEARAAFTRLVELAAAAGDERTAAIAQGHIADILTQQGQLDEALRICREEVLPVLSRLGEVREVAITQGQIAGILTQQGQLDEALRICREEELPVYRRLGEVRHAAIAQSRIADILFQQGQLDEALRIRREEELPVYRRLGDERSAAITQGRIADILFQQGQLDEALRIRREEVLPVLSRLGEVREVAIAQSRIADILTQQGQLDEALRLQMSRLATNRKLQDQDGIAVTLWDIGTIELEQNKRGEASLHIGEAWQILLGLGRVDAIAVVGELWGQLLTQAGHADEAGEVLRRSSEAYRQLGLTDKSQAVEELIKQL
jgi:predicted negative regulator of RcsB-dependent stress response